MQKTSLNQDTLWSYFQNELPASFQGAKPRIHFILKRILRSGSHTPVRVLNVGAGDGYLEESAHRFGLDIYSLDPDMKTIDRLLEKKIKAYQGHIEQMPFEDEMFDFVIASEVLEHLDEEQFEKGIAEIRRVMKVGASFIGTVPYQEDLSTNIVICPHCETVFHRWGHKRAFDIKTVEQQMSLFFSDLSVRKKTFVAFKERNLSGKIKSLARLLIGYFGAAIASSNIYFEARKTAK